MPQVYSTSGKKSSLLQYCDKKWDFDSKTIPTKNYYFKFIFSKVKYLGCKFYFCKFSNLKLKKCLRLIQKYEIARKVRILIVKIIPKTMMVFKKFFRKFQIYNINFIFANLQILNLKDKKVLKDKKPKKEIFQKFRYLESKTYISKVQLFRKYSYFKSTVILKVQFLVFLSTGN